MQPVGRGQRGATQAQGTLGPAFLPPLWVSRSSFRGSESHGEAQIEARLKVLPETAGQLHRTSWAIFRKPFQ